MSLIKLVSLNGVDVVESTQSKIRSAGIDEANEASFVMILVAPLSSTLIACSSVCPSASFTQYSHDDGRKFGVECPDSSWPASTTSGATRAALVSRALSGLSHSATNGGWANMAGMVADGAYTDATDK